MRKDTIVGILFAVACLSMLVGTGTILASCEEYSDASYEEVKATVGHEMFSDDYKVECVIAADLYSDDYKEGYADGAKLFKNMGACTGILGIEYIILKSLDKGEDEIFTDALRKVILEQLAPLYNKQVKEYNINVRNTNLISYLVLGDDVTEDQLMEEQPYFY